MRAPSTVTAIDRCWKTSPAAPRAADGSSHERSVICNTVASARTARPTFVAAEGRVATRALFAGVSRAGGQRRHGAVWFSPFDDQKSLSRPPRRGPRRREASKDHGAFRTARTARALSLSTASAEPIPFSIFQAKLGLAGQDVDDQWAAVGSPPKIGSVAGVKRP